MYEELKSLEPFSLSMHDDADGVYSGAILSSIFKVKKVEFPEFHEYSTDVAVDLGYPANTDWKGILIDHHPIPKDIKFKCSIYWENVPTGLILYRHLKKYFPKEITWYVIGSLTGDGQPELVPTEIWKQYPILLEERGILYKFKEVRTSAYPMFYYLSSGVNAFCRLGNPRRAYELVLENKDPLDFIEHPEVIDAILFVRKEEENLYKSRFLVERYGTIVFVRIETTREEYKFSSLVASRLYNSEPNLTFLVLNEKNGRLSIRGYLSNYLVEYLNKYNFKVGGHPGFAGGRIPLERLSEFTKVMRRVRYEI